MMNGFEENALLKINFLTTDEMHEMLLITKHMIFIIAVKARKLKTMEKEKNGLADIVIFAMILEIIEFTEEERNINVIQKNLIVNTVTINQKMMYDLIVKRSWKRRNYR